MHVSAGKGPTGTFNAGGVLDDFNLGTRIHQPPHQAEVATKNLSGARSGTLPEGGSLTGGHLHHPNAIHDEEGVVHPRG